jgi:uncharacterized delta-60 repeat protein
MKHSTVARWIGIGMLACALAACGGGGADPAPAPGTMGPAGGTVTGPGGAQVVVPPGAVAQNIVISVEQSSAGAPALPSGVTSVGEMFAFTPHGTRFAVPVTITVPFDPSQVPAGARPALYKTNATRTAFEPVPGATVNGSTLSGQVTGFSNVFGGTENGLQRDDPHRTWVFDKFTRTGPLDPNKPLESDSQTGGELRKPFVFGGSGVFDLTGDSVANGEVFSTADGKSYSALAEAPSANGNDPAQSAIIGGLTALIQSQSFIKRAPNATLQLILTAASFDAADSNGALTLRECPRQNEAGGDPLQLWILCGDVIHAHVQYLVQAYRADQPSFLLLDAFAFMEGFNGNWVFDAFSYADASQPLWTPANFTVDGLKTPRALAQLNGPLTVEVDLSSIDVCPLPLEAKDCKDREFTLSAQVIAYARNNRGRESGIVAFLRDPQGGTGGSALKMSGLEATNNPAPAPSNDAPVPCSSGPDPAAGVLQFSADTYSVREAPLSQPSILVTRTQGSRGAVSATFSTSDGTAASGVDYSAPPITVRFADGDTTPRLVPLTVLPNTLAAPDKTLNLRLSDAGGCATIGPRSSAVLTILDDDQPAPANSFSVGGTVTGLTGGGLKLRQNSTGEDLAAGNGTFAFLQRLSGGIAYDVTVSAQPSNPSQVCSVANGSGTITNFDITNVAVTCTTPPPNTALDTSFGSGGKVATPATGSGNAVALQADGRIVTAGGGFTLTRHKSDGSLDATFGTGGKVTTGFGASVGTANDVAIQSDGKIVVAGSIRAASEANFGVRRYNADGSLDASFGTGGLVETDFAALADVAKAIVIQPDGKIVVAGQAQNATGTDLAVARYNTDGSLDASFGSGGKLTTDVAGGFDFGVAMVLQPDGRILVLARVSLPGSVVVSIPALVRYNSDGSLDAGFGAGGKVMAASTGPSSAIALQSDGKIIVGGSVNAGTSNSAFGLIRFLANGSVDAAFGTPTTSFFSGGNGSLGRAVAVQADGKIVLAGEAASGASSTFDVAVARFDTNGSLDAGFGTGGKLLVDFFADTDSAADVVIQPDGKIVVAGSARNGSFTEFALMRLNR